ncbi:GNAT family N-acetyltransferase [Solibacillus sp. MA9]|uniref:GNAT family N-acetyltransferase n=1 Tax=Solibacillus palustris TaxID=2908203 RepID=A0ABS9UFP8_9BACL|nr:GNAT family N-acetyltransferase [Solibacillus sp. MA9]MCH7323178.1 GNAT family N-acetyltransferase [Solibacillus sp. MA9]
MITELQKQDFHKCLNVLNEQGQLEAKAIAMSVNPGRIFVDKPSAPTTGMIWLGNNDGFILFGDDSNQQFNGALNAFIDEVITPDAKKVGLKWFEVVGNHEKWNATIETLFKHRTLGSWNQKVYTLNEQSYQRKGELSLPQGYTIHKINEQLYGESTIQNITFLHETIEEFWSSPEQFFNNGIAYGAFWGNEIVSICYSGFVVNNIHCVGIETLAEHQGKKLAQILAHYFVQDCFENGMTVYWDCMEGNKPSVAVAEKIGFHNTFNYVGYEFSF